MTGGGAGTCGGAPPGVGAGNNWMLGTTVWVWIQQRPVWFSRIFIVAVLASVREKAWWTLSTASCRAWSVSRSTTSQR
jgi:hypothetical protein